MTQELRRLMLEETPPPLSTMRLLGELETRIVRRKRRRGLGIAVTALAATSGVVLATGLRSDVVAYLPAFGNEGVATCGNAPKNQGPAQNDLRATLNVQSGTHQSGQRLTVGMVFRSKSEATVSFDTSNPEVLIIKDSKIVGRYVGGNAGTGLGVSVTGAKTQVLPAFVTLRGCPTGDPDPYKPDLSRPLLSPGTYKLVAVAREAVAVDPSIVVSEPALITVM